MTGELLRTTSVIVLGVSLFVLSGCTQSAEDRAFFQRGWFMPESGSDARMYRSSGPDTRPQSNSDRLDQSGTLGPAMR